MTVLRDLRVEAGLSVTDLAREAKTSRNTIDKAEKGEPISGHIAGRICQVLSDKLGRHITYKDAQITIL